MEAERLKLRELLFSEKFLESLGERFENCRAQETDAKSVIKATIPDALMDMTILPEHFERKINFFGHFFAVIFEDLSLAVFGPDLHTQGGLDYSNDVVEKMAMVLRTKRNNETIEQKRQQLIFFLFLHHIIPLFPEKPLKETNRNLH